MSHRGTNRLRLAPRNEGKIKHFESCSDLRAWNLNPKIRDQYLREWMTGDMPSSILSARTLVGFLQNNSVRNCTLATPLCHPDCKSKVILDSIIEASAAMKECLKKKLNCEKYFDEEELETGNWPCERCLDALKSIKMFWKVMAERILNTKVSKNPNQMVDAQCECEASVLKVADLWKNQIISDTYYADDINRQSKIESSFEKADRPIPIRNMKQSRVKIIRCNDEEDVFKEQNRSPRTKSLNGSVKLSRNTKASDIMSEPRDIKEQLNRQRSVRPSFKVNRFTSVKVRTTDAGCNPCPPHDDSKEVAFVKTMDLLSELAALRKENIMLKMGLKKLMDPKKSAYPPNPMQDNNGSLLNLEGDEFISDPISINTDSEMIITLKKCKNTKYQHVSLLQVLHKTNEPKFLKDLIQDQDIHDSRNEDPIQLLKKVKTTFGEIVRREIDIANEKLRDSSKFDVNATYQSMDSPCRKTHLSKPSCSSLSGCGSTFVSLT